MTTKKERSEAARVLGSKSSPAKRRAARERALAQWARWREHGGTRPGSKKKGAK